MKLVGIPFVLVIFYNPLHCYDDEEFVQYAQDEFTHYGNIIFSAMVFRHGDRNQLCTYPSNPHNAFFKQAGKGELNQAGKTRAFRLGVWARKRYNELIKNKPYSPDLFQVLSSDSDRTIQSAQLLLAGFYPPISTEKEIWNKNMLWQPIAVHSIPRNRDRIIMMREYCGRYNLEVQRLSNSAIVERIYEEYKKWFEYIEEYAKVTIPRGDIFMGMRKFSAFYDCFHVQELTGLTQPEWSAPIYPDILKPAEVTYFKMHTLNDEMKRLKGGALLDHIIKELQDKQQNPQSDKLFQFYSGHDSTIVALLDTLGVYDDKLVEYSASVLIELRRKNQDFFVTVSYRNNGQRLELLEIPGCEVPCTLDGFIQATKSFVPEDWEKECMFFERDYNTILF